MNGRWAFGPFLVSIYVLGQKYPCNTTSFSRHLPVGPFHAYHGRPPAIIQMTTLIPCEGSWIRYPVWQHTFVSPSAFSKRAVVSYWQKYVHEALVNRLGGLSLPRKSVVRLTDRPDMTLDVYCGRKTTLQQCNNNNDSMWNVCEYTLKLFKGVVFHRRQCNASRL